MQSFVTGQIAVELSTHPNTPVTLVGAEPQYFEVPTIPSTAEKLGKAFADFDLQDLLDDIEGAAEGIDELANSPKLRDAIASLDQTLKDFGQLARNIDAKLEPVVVDIDETSAAARRALDQFTKSLVSVEGTLNATLEDAQTLVQNLDGQVEHLSFG